MLPAFCFHCCSYVACTLVHHAGSLECICTRICTRTRTGDGGADVSVHLRRHLLHRCGTGEVGQDSHDAIAAAVSTARGHAAVLFTSSTRPVYNNPSLNRL